MRGEATLEIEAIAARLGLGTSKSLKTKRHRHLTSPSIQPKSDWRFELAMKTEPNYQLTLFLFSFSLLHKP